MSAAETHAKAITPWKVVWRSDVGIVARQYTRNYHRSHRRARPVRYRAWVDQAETLNSARALLAVAYPPRVLRRTAAVLRKMAPVPENRPDPAVNIRPAFRWV